MMYDDTEIMYELAFAMKLVLCKVIDQELSTSLKV